MPDHVDCVNCTESFDPLEGLILLHKNVRVAAVCSDCCANVRVGKLIVQATAAPGHRFEATQWSPMEMAHSRLSSSGVRSAG